MATLDATTQAEYAAEVNAADRAQVIVDALADPVTVNVYNASSAVVGSGTMTAPWATVSSYSVIPGTLDDFFVTSSDPPNDDWRLKFESGSRNVSLTFGLSGSGAEAIWSGASFSIGTRAGISSSAIAATGNRAPAWSGAPESVEMTAGGTQSFSSYASDPDEDQLVFSLVSPPTGYSISTTGVLTAGASSQSVTMRVTDPDGLYADHVCSVTVSVSTAATYIIPANGASNTSRTYDAASLAGFNGANWVTTGGVTRRPQAGDVIELSAGTHGVTRFSNIIGTPTNRITIRGPSDSVAIIRRLNPSTGDFVVRLTNCRYFNFDGYSTAGNRNCGIRVTYAQNAVAGTGTANKDGPSSFIKWFQKTDNCRMSYVEIAGGWEYNGTPEGSGYTHTGLGMETGDTGNTLTAYPGGQFQENIELSYFYIHKTRGEGLYLGPNWDDVPREIPVRNIELHHSYFYRNGSGGAQGKCWFEGDNSMHHNTIIECGLRGGIVNQRRALAILSGCGRVHDNWIQDMGGESTMTSTYTGVNPGGIMFYTDGGPIKGALDANLYGPYSTFKVYAYNNLIFGCGNATLPAQGINTGHTSGVDCVDPEPYFFNNTVVDSSAAGMQVNSAVGGFVRNNIVVANAGGNITTSGSTSVVADNTTDSTVGDRFIDAAAKNYRLASADLASGPIGANGPVSVTDISGASRATGTADKGCYEYP